MNNSNQPAQVASSLQAPVRNSRPILFSAPMVRAILDGVKTQTRRVVKPPRGMEARHAGVDFGCPYGAVGDFLWVREAFRLSDTARDCACYETCRCKSGEPIYRASDSEPDEGGPWKPGIFMPRALSRITLEITDVRVEHLLEITDGDARAEGIRVLPGQRADDVSAWWQSSPGQHQARTPRGAYALLWRDLNGAGSWSLNPHVWVIQFQRVPNTRLTDGVRLPNGEPAAGSPFGPSAMLGLRTED